MSPGQSKMPESRISIPLNSKMDLTLSPLITMERMPAGFILASPPSMTTTELFSHPIWASLNFPKEMFFLATFKQAPISLLQLQANH